MTDDQICHIDAIAGKLARQGLIRFRGLAASFRRAAHVPPTRDAGAQPESILVVKLWGLGSMVMASRAFRSLRLGFPNARITVVTTASCAQLYARSGLYDRHILFSCPDLVQLPQCIAAFTQRLSAEPWDMAINLDGMSELSALIAHKSCASRTIGFEAPGENRFGYTDALAYDPHMRISDLLYDRIRSLGGAPVEEPFVRPDVPDTDRATVARMFADRHLNPRALFVGININSGAFAPERRWPAEKFALLAESLAQEGDVVPVFFGASDENRHTMRCLKLMSHTAPCFAGELSLGQYLAWIERLHLFVGNDSGSLQLAAALGIPTVGIFGPESPSRVRLTDSEEHADARIPMPCAPCLSLFEMKKRPCPSGHRCIQSLPLEHVRSLVMDMLQHLSDPIEPPWLRAGIQGTRTNV